MTDLDYAEGTVQTDLGQVIRNLSLIGSSCDRPKLSQSKAWICTMGCEDLVAKSGRKTCKTGVVTGER